MPKKTHFYPQIFPRNQKYGCPDSIRIEMAREVKMGFEKRNKLAKEQRAREKESKNALEIMNGLAREKETTASKKDAMKYLLWKEQGGQCAYTGEEIDPKLILTGEVNIDHILPRIRSCDDSQSNKVLCFQSANQEKGDRTPMEWLGASSERFAEAEKIFKRFKDPKKREKLFVKNVEEIDDFFHRDFNDASYIARAVRDYVRPLGADVVCTKGKYTAQVRGEWELNGILHPEGENVKFRADYRHHAIDALAIAFADRSTLQKLARRRGRKDKSQIPYPWNGFMDDAAKAIRSLIVSHRPRRKIKGGLHEDGNYHPLSPKQIQRLIDEGVVDPKKEGKNLYSIHKPVADLSPGEVGKIVDRLLREQALRIQENANKNFKKFGEILTKPMTKPDGTAVNRVQVAVADDSIVLLGGRYVATGNNHHIAIYEIADERGKKKRVYRNVTMLDAARIAMQYRQEWKEFKRTGISKSEWMKTRNPIVQPVHPDYPDSKLIAYFCNGDIVFMDGEYYRCTSWASTSAQIWFLHHAVADGKKIKEFHTEDSEIKYKTSCKPSTYNGQKIEINVLGEVICPVKKQRFFVR